ncbi:hypothetical protein PFICI_08347 [Pestalotiopsis fici W106-1]|uniref:Uncharacterized protein n=1 Tax=Pestalotiopsis fici (strain W106-1 / CGMCC3.15140) TaxID=1229662 RepID=W3X3W1_PESFW|nr:uncharacterized protein PFICI_08347 [Pestalotiopsis fici W106-1]ETS80818.1 hypothetical protein PFICI_08347 [Pestalotiopsis fici W106-1]
MAEIAMDSQELPIWVAFTGNSRPLVFDLSGAVPFELYLTARRSAVDETDPRDLVLLKTGSVFDFSAALDKGLVELVDDATGAVIPRHRSTVETGAEEVTCQSLDDESFIRLPTDVQRRDRPTQKLPLNVASCLRAMVESGRNYHVRLHGKNLGVRWWKWAENSKLYIDGSELPPSEHQEIVSVGPPRSKTFTVKSEIPIPPKPYIGLSLAHTGESASDDASSPILQITIKNTSERPIILKTIGDQRHLKEPGEITNPRARVTHERPNLQNFSIIDQETKEDLISDAPTFTTPVPGRGRGWPRKQFLALAPQEQVVRTAKLPGHRLVPGRKYNISLRSTGCWWTYGTLDDLFGKGNNVFQTWPPGPKVPMPLESEDVVVVNCK